MKNFIKRIDLFGKPLQLRLGKHIKRSTIFGGIMSLITYLLVCLSLISKLFEYLKRSEPGVNFRITKSTSPIQMNLNYQSLDLIFTLVDSDSFNVIYDVDTYFDIEFLYMVYTKPTTNETSIEREANEIVKKNCTELNGPDYKILNKYDEDLLKCSICMGNKLINESRIENIILNGTFLDNKYSQISIKIKNCN